MLIKLIKIVLIFLEKRQNNKFSLNIIIIYRLYKNIKIINNNGKITKKG